MSRVGLGRHTSLHEDAGNPLDGIVNLFDLGIVLAVGFLVAALGAVELQGKKNQALPRNATQAPEQRGKPITPPASGAPVTGAGQAVGTVYQLSDGRLVYVRGDKKRGR